MSNEQKLVLQRDAERLRLLKAVFKIANGSERRRVMLDDELTEAAGLHGDSFEDALAWLCSKGLLERETVGWVKLTHEGANEVEDLIRHPDGETEHFSSPVIKMVNNFTFAGATIGAVQTGPDAVANVQQSIGVMPEKLIELFAQLRSAGAALPDDEQRAVVAEAVNELEAEAKKEKRNEARIKLLATGLSTFTALLPALRALGLYFGFHI